MPMSHAQVMAILEPSDQSTQHVVVVRPSKETDIALSAATHLLRQNGRNTSVVIPADAALPIF